MGSIVFTFVGICTHVNKVSLTPPRDAYTWQIHEPAPFTRVVLPDASLGYRWGDQNIPPHQAVLLIQRKFIASTSGPLPGLSELDDVYLRRTCGPGPSGGMARLEGDVYLWRMGGVQLYATEAAQNITQTEESYAHLPSLTEVAGDMKLDLDPRVVLEGRAAAVVDLYGGTRDAYTPEGETEAIHGTFTVRTASQRLAVVRMRDQARGFIQLQDAPVLMDDQTRDSGGLQPLIEPPRVFVLNTGHGGDAQEDFLLHYYVTTWAPPPDQEPPRPANYSGVRKANEVETRHLGLLPDGLTFGCSNSTYP